MMRRKHGKGEDGAADGAADGGTICIFLLIISGYHVLLVQDRVQ